MFTRNTSQAQIAASGDFFQTSFIPCSDPLLTAAEKTAICAAAAAQGGSKTVAGYLAPVTGANVYIGRRNVEGGPRIAAFQSDSIRQVVGVKGDFATAWTYDVYAQRSSVDNSNQNLNYFNNANIVNSTFVVAQPATLPSGAVNRHAGQPVCASVLNGTDPKCVPWNIWVPNGVSAAALNYLSIPLLVAATTTEYVVEGDVVGDLGKYGIKVPMANEGIKVSFGASWRSESANFSAGLPERIGQCRRFWRPDATGRRRIHGEGNLHGIHHADCRPRPVCRLPVVVGRLSLFRLQRGIQDQHFQDWYGMGADTGREAPRQFPASGARTQHC